MPDAKTLWLFRVQLARHGLVEKLFEAFDRHIWYAAFISKGGQVIDASLVNVTRNRNKRTKPDTEKMKICSAMVFWEFGLLRTH